MRRRGGQAGQATAEYVGLIVVVAAILVALLASGAPRDLADGLRDAVCEIVSLDSCREEPESELEAVDRLADADLDDFIAERDSEDRDDRLDWSSDDCSAPLVGSTGVSFDFTDACRRHDFGYRNYKDLGVFEERKAEVDNRFLADMKAHCATRSPFLQPSCYRWAYTFYYAVRAFG